MISSTRGASADAFPLTSFHPTVSRWFGEKLGEPTEPQKRGWPAIAAGRHTLIAAPTGSGKTLAAFLHAIDSLVGQGSALADQTQVLYVSPLKALSNDVQKNLQGPLDEMATLDPSLPEIRVLVRTGDTPAKDREAMKRRPPHILVTTPESLYILLTSEGGRGMLETVSTVIVDEVHALAGDKRGSHLTLSLERLESLVGAPLQRVGLSATQKPLSDMAQFLVGAGRECEAIDAGHLRELDLAIEVPPSPLSAVCSHEVWDEIYARMAELIAEHRTTLVFVNTRKLAERLARRLAELIDEEHVACHHSSLSKERRLDAEQRLKNGELSVLVATASLELGIDIGDVDLVIQIGVTRAIATLLQRVGRSGHVLGKIPKGRVFPLTQDELIESIALVRGVNEGDLDRILQPSAPLDVLAQQVVASCAGNEWTEDALYESLTRSASYRDLPREDFDAVIAMHSKGRHALLHRDGVGGRVMGTRRTRLTSITSGGAIPDNADYRVVLEPEGTFVGTLNEDFAIESSAGDIFQLGNASWRILRVHGGTVRVADAHGAPPTIPFWFGEAPSRTRELTRQLSRIFAEPGDPLLETVPGVPAAGIEQLREYLGDTERVLGKLPTMRRVVMERFFDESGGMQLVIHSLFGGRINRAWGLALRKRFCRGFGFELQAAATEQAILLSLGLQQSFALEEVFDYLKPETARKVLVQAMLDKPMFETRWRWNVTRSLLVERMRGGRKVPAPLLRFRADDLLAEVFPEIAACGENLPPGDLPVPEDHPMVRQTVEDCLFEAMDLEGFTEVLAGLRDGTIERHAVDVPQPSPLAQGVLNAQPFAFLDDAPLEERRTQAVMSRRSLDTSTVDELGALDSEAIERVREEAWPNPENDEEVHEALTWMGYVTSEEGESWQPSLSELEAAGRVVLEGEKYFATEASRDPVEVLRGRMEALGPVVSDDPVMVQLEQQGVVLRVRFDGRDGWCNRRLLARIRRYTLERLRSEIKPVTTQELLRFFAVWQHVTPDTQLTGPHGAEQVLEQLAGLEIAAARWERDVLPARVKLYMPEHVDQPCMTGLFSWGRLWGSASVPIRTTPIAFVKREELPAWTRLAEPIDTSAITGAARQVYELLRERGALFAEEIQRDAELLPSQVEMALGELIARGLITCDSFSGLRLLIFQQSRRRRPLQRVGRWSFLRNGVASEEAETERFIDAEDVELVARQLLGRTGVVFRKLVQRERTPVPWRDLLRFYRTLEARGEIRGGRFVAGFDGEQFALPEAVRMLRQVRKRKDWEPVTLSAADPLNYTGILTPEERVSPNSKGKIVIG